MSGRDQLFRIGAGLVLETGREPVALVFEDA